MDKNAMTVAVQNLLTDYSFKLENLAIETNIENATLNPNDLPQTTFEVLDTNNLRINFSFNQSTIKALSGRRLQFRIKDKERGDSDWYTIKQTFVRIPQIESVKCTNEMNNQCELKGDGLDYISQVSMDGGRTWNTNNLQVQVTEDGKTKILIPLLINHKFLQIKLRDYPNTEGLPITGFAYSNSIRKTANNKSTTGPPKTQSNGNPILTQNNQNQLSNPPAGSNPAFWTAAPKAAAKRGLKSPKRN